MKQMQIVIDIPEEVIKIDKEQYEFIKQSMPMDKVKDYHALLYNICERIKNGTPLPKGHRFIDADEILNHAFIRDDEEGDIFVQKYYCIEKEIMDKALVLFDTLEADKE